MYNVYGVSVSVSLFDQYTLTVEHSTRSRTSMTSLNDDDDKGYNNKQQQSQLS